MRPDFKIGFYGNEFGIIEAKKVSTCLNAPHGYEHSYSPIDQTLRYFDRLGSRYAIATNGLEWIVFRQASAYAEEFSCKYEAIRINLQYTIKYYDPDLFDEFLYNFDYFRLMRGGWPSFGSSFQKRVQFQRNSGLVDVLMQDFSCDNEYVSS
ncbi:hypothetical protein C8J40_105183 [Sphingomonas sp. PP-CC-3A-396]|nr:hypothetical protein C8J40_105183 [Sphingomonas sp. PP-CC-3A-396]